MILYRVGFGIQLFFIDYSGVDLVFDAAATAAAVSSLNCLTSALSVFLTKLRLLRGVASHICLTTRFGCSVMAAIRRSNVAVFPFINQFLVGSVTTILRRFSITSIIPPNPISLAKMMAESC